ncbi:MAG: DUF1552 domain-containing protein [Kofleriaceae bacterium]|nr:DUF1552 domain-containing protein [Kofleriaceae bacterium]MBP6835728.1 DUF1552 domain-containing protein [Kofleriaceae bacterium]MBP9208443.1 DUF1552 domain-containing protein [Kofleriaceae bacterium]
MSLSRRRFLGGAAALVGLPLLTSLLPRPARGAGPVPKRRFVGFYLPCGIHMQAWTPGQEGAGWAATPILSPIMPYQAKSLVLTGVDNLPGRSIGGGDHAAGTGAFLTAFQVKKTANADIENRTSLDQVLAPVLSAGLPFPSLQLGVNDGPAAGDCDTGYSCAYITTVSWANATTPLPKQSSPRAAFDRMFAGYDPNATLAEIERRKRYRTSVLDNVVDEATSLRGRLGRTDQGKLDEYLTSVRELEQRINGPTGVCLPGTRPEAGLGFAERARAMIDLIGVSFQCDQTRVVTFMLGNGGSYESHPHIGITDPHHELSHHMSNQVNFDKLTQIGTWEMEQVAYLLSKLEAIDDGEGLTALDNSAVYVSSEIGDGDRHNHDDMPVFLAGGLSGALATGRHLRVNRPVADLFLTVLQTCDPDGGHTSFGNSTGPMTEIQAG